MAARWPARSVACRALMALRECPVAGGTGLHPSLGDTITGFLPSVQPGIQAALLLGRCRLREGSACVLASPSAELQSK